MLGKDDWGGLGRTTDGTEGLTLEILRKVYVLCGVEILGGPAFTGVLVLGTLSIATDGILKTSFTDETELPIDVRVD